MRIFKAFNKRRPEVSRTPLKSFKNAWLTDSLKVNPSDPCNYAPDYCSQLHPHIHPPHQQIAALSPGMGRLSPSLIKSLQTTDDCTPKSAATHAVSIRTDSGFSNLAFSSLLCNFSTGTLRDYGKILARQLQQPE